MYRDEYRLDCRGVRDYKITFLGIPIFIARFTSTNNQAVRQLTIMEENKLTIKGFGKNEAENLCKKNQ